MRTQVSAQNIRGNGVNLSFEGLPDRCPICHVSILPVQHTAKYRGEANEADGELQIVFQCTNNRCESLFFGIYRYYRDAGSNHFYALERLTPLNAEEVGFSEFVREVSPAFIEIYNQAIAAEAAGLYQLTGIGLRKALEFLVKDFSIRQHPTKDEEIKKTLLAQCINNYIDDPNVKQCAQRATWLGNDETHYIRKWADKDVNDLKILIRLTVNWIDNVLLTQKYVTEMNP